MLIFAADTKLRLMKRTSSLYLITECLVLLAAFTSCWQDRSGEYYALIGSKSWIYTTMQEYYLYYQDVPEERKEESV